MQADNGGLCPVSVRLLSYKLWVQTEITKVWGDENTRWKLFITRFFDCEMCHGHMEAGPAGKCHASVREHYKFASCRSHRCAAPHVLFSGAAVVQ